MRGIVRQRGSIGAPLIVLSIYMAARARRVRADPRSELVRVRVRADPRSELVRVVCALILAQSWCASCARQVPEFRAVCNSGTAARPGLCNITIDPAP